MDHLATPLRGRGLFALLSNISSLHMEASKEPDLFIPLVYLYTASEVDWTKNHYPPLSSVLCFSLEFKILSQTWAHMEISGKCKLQYPAAFTGLDNA